MRYALCLVCGLSLAPNAAWAEAEEAWTNYLGVLGTYGWIDTARAANMGEAIGPMLLFGSQRASGWGYEIQGFAAVQETRGSATTDFYRWGAGADLVYSMGDRLSFTPFLLAGASYALNDVTPDTLDKWDWSGNAGVGFVTAPQFGGFFRIRAEARVIYDNYGDRVQGDPYRDYQFGLGVEFLPRPLPAEPAQPAEPAEREVPVRVVEVATGLLDSDDDGIVDGRDRCPDTAPGARVDGRGCPLPDVWSLDGVTFEVDSAKLRVDSLTILKGVAAVLLRYPDMDVEIAGHTDATGSERYNDRLSIRRATSVRNHLISLGVPAKQMELRGYGEHEPVRSNRTPAGRERNRRVELHIIGGSGVPELQGKP